MPQSRPLATDLLAIVQDYLAAEIAPQVSPVHQFQLKIVSRVLATVQRELALRPGADAAEQQRLRELLQEDGELPELQAKLARAIRAGRFEVDDAALLAHLRATNEDALRIDSPKWLSRG